MKSRYEVVLNDVALSDISADIVILDIGYPQPSLNYELFSTAKRQGARIHRKYIQKNSVQITFEIHNYSTLERQRICNAVSAWAKNGGVLRTNDRDGQRLRCVCEKFPSVSSAMRWTDPLSMTFSAYVLPFWEEITPVSLSLSGTSGSGSLFVPGNFDGAFVEVDITALGALTGIELIANKSVMALSELSMIAGQTVRIAYDDELIQSIKSGNISLLGNRTGADDLLANCGENNSFIFTANTSVDVTFRVRGLWL